MGMAATQPDDAVMGLNRPTRIMAAPRPTTPITGMAASPHDEHLAATLTTPIMAAPRRLDVSGMMSVSPKMPDVPTTMSRPVVASTAPLEQIEGHLQNRLMSNYRKDADPYGSPDNHPGFLGKFLHGLSVATGGPSRREFQEEELEKRLNDVTGLESRTGLEGAQAAKARADVPFEEAQTENLRNPPASPLETAEGYYSFNPRTREVQPIEAPGATTPLQPYMKPGAAQHVVLQGPSGQPMAAVFRDGTYYDATTGKPIPNPVPFEKPTQEHPQAGMANGRPAFAVYDQQKGWMDPNTKQPIANFTPQPTFAQTGLWQPTEGVDPKSGQMVPGMLNERTGEFRTTMAGNAPAALPRDVTSELGKELQTAREADKRLRIMESNQIAAMKGDQQAMLSIVANHIGMTLGAQKGARINQAVWDEAVKAAPWLQNAEKRWGKDGLLQGVVLSPDQIRQMVDLGQVVRDNQWKQAEQAFGQYGIPINAPAEEHGSRTGNTSPTAAAPPSGAKFQGKGSDGKMYWLDADRKPIAEVK